MKNINLSHNLLGCRFDNWLRLKHQNTITKKKQGYLITLASLLLGIPSLLEWLIFYYPIRRTPITRDPIYIVGFWRSGTTFLQNLMTRDPQYGWFDPVKTISFNNCILMKPLMAMAEKKRTEKCASDG